MSVARSIQILVFGRRLTIAASYPNSKTYRDNDAGERSD